LKSGMEHDNTPSFSIPARELLRCVPPWECHLHTLYTDGTATVGQYARKAYETGLSRIILTEHAEPWRAKKGGWFANYVREVRTVAEEYAGRLEVYAGIEAPAIDFDNGLELTEEMRSEVDFILGTAHRYPGLGNRRVHDLSRKEFISLEFMTLMALARNTDIDAIAHMGGTCRLYCCELPEDMAAEVVKTAADNGVAIELNSKYHAPLTHLLEICIRENARVTIGSDAHSLNEIGTAFKSVLKAVETMAQ
jgi:putative hydrolase